MIVVSDSTTLIYLSKLGHLDLLRQLYSTVRIPPAVWGEVARPGKPGVAALIQARADRWLIVEAPQSTIDVSRVPRFSRLHAGEREAILLALDHQPSILLVDEREAFLLTVQVYSSHIDAAALPDVIEECVGEGLLTDGEARRLSTPPHYRPATSVTYYRQDHPTRRPARPR